MQSTSLNLSTELTTWQQQLQAWALSGALAQAAQSALLLDEEARRELDAWLALLAAGDFGSLPAIELLDASAMPGAAGAYAASTGTIYLNASWLESASSEQISAVLSEELGHWLDSWLNGSDTQGDEGELFAGLLLGQTLSSEEFKRILLENDQLSVTLASGEVVLAEGATIIGTDANDVLVGTDPGAASGDDLLTGTEFDDLIDGKSGNDTISGLAGDDILIGGDGNDSIDGGTGINRIFGDAGDDVIASRGSDTIDGGSGKTSSTFTQVLAIHSSRPVGEMTSFSSSPTSRAQSKSKLAMARMS